MDRTRVTIQVNVVERGQLVRARWQEPVDAPTSLHALVGRTERRRSVEGRLLSRWLSGELPLMVLLDDQVLEPAHAQDVVVVGGQTIRVLTPVAGG